MRIRLTGAVLLIGLALISTSGAIASHGPKDVTFKGTLAAGAFAQVGLGAASYWTSGSGAFGVCNPHGPGDGVDGAWIELPAGSSGHPYELSFTSELPADLVVELFDSGCGFIDAIDLGGVDEPESGVFPAGTAYVIVTGKNNGPVDWSFTVFLSRPSSLPDPSTLHELGSIEPFEAIAEDGTALRGHVYLPKGTGPFATVLEFNFWWSSDGPTASVYPTDRWATEVDGRRTMREHFGPLMDAGFAVAVVNMRGTGKSSGCFPQADPIGRSDIATVIEALAAKPWNSGQIGVYGFSWSGYTSFEAIASGTPSLGAVVAVSPVSDMWNLWSVNGAHRANRSWTAEFTALAIAAPSSDVAGGSLDTEPSRAACPRYADDARAEAELRATGDRTPYWEMRDLRSHLKGSTVPVLSTVGILDEGVPADGGHIRQLNGVWKLLDGPRHFVFGQRGHYEPRGQRADWDDMVVGWFDRYLRGGPETVEPGVVEFQDVAGRWHSTRGIPRPTERLWLSKTTLIDDRDEVRTGQQAFISGGVPCVGLCPDLTFPRVEQCAGDQASWVSQPLKRSVVLAGRFKADLTITSNLPDGNLAVYLWATPGTGACPDSEVRQVGKFVGDLRHVRGDDGEDFPVNSPTRIRVKSDPFAIRVPAGSRLVLAIGGHSSELAPDATRPTISVHTGPEVAGRLRLPVIGGELRF